MLTEIDAESALMQDLAEIDLWPEGEINIPSDEEYNDWLGRALSHLGAEWPKNQSFNPFKFP